MDGGWYASDFLLRFDQNFCLGSCVFPESEIEPFFFDLLSNTPEDSIVVDTVVEPPNAKIQIANIRSNNIPNVILNYGHGKLN